MTGAALVAAAGGGLACMPSAAAAFPESVAVLANAGEVPGVEAVKLKAGTLEVVGESPEAADDALAILAGLTEALAG